MNYDPCQVPITSFSGEYRFLSNMFPCRIVYEGIIYPATENAYVAHKTSCIETRKKIASMKPTESKVFGRGLELVENWGVHKIKVMRDIVELKFSIPDLREKLIDTYPRKIIEGNTWGDTFWGECPLGNGKNNLGLILMETRYKIMEVEKGNFILE